MTINYTWKCKQSGKFVYTQLTYWDMEINESDELPNLSPEKYKPQPPILNTL